MEVAKDVQLLTQGVTNFYLIEEAGKFTVVDAGTRGRSSTGPSCPSAAGARPR